MPTGLDTFREVLTDFRNVSGLITKAAIGLPLADLFLDVGPPWPPYISLIVAVFELAILIAVFEYWYRSSRAKQRRRMGVFGLTMVVGLFAYLFLDSKYVVTSPTEDRVVMGHEVRRDVVAVREPGETTLDLLRLAQYRAEEVWTPDSVTRVRMALVATWLLTFVGLAGFIAVFVVVQRRQPAGRARGAAEGAPAGPP